MTYPRQYDIEALRTRMTISEIVDCAEMPEVLAEAITWLTERLGEVPEPLREGALFKIGLDYDGDTEIEITYNRPETDEEWAARRAGVERRVALHAAAERAEYERLAAKFKGRS